MSNQEIDLCIEDGIKHGFKVCCIEFFVSNIYESSWRDYVKKYGTGDGYMRCINCIEEVSENGTDTN